MNLKIKDEYLDCSIVHPASGRTLFVRFDTNPSEYEYFYNHGYQHLFDVVEETITPDEQEPTKENTEDTSN